MKLSELVGEPVQTVAYAPQLRAIAGSVNAVVLLSQLLYWTGKQRDPDGWIQKRTSAPDTSLDSGRDPSMQNLPAETGLTYKELKRARRILRGKGFLRERRDYAEHVIYFRLDTDAIRAAWIRVYGEPLPKHTSVVTQKDIGDGPSVHEVMDQRDMSDGPSVHEVMDQRDISKVPSGDLLNGTSIDYTETTSHLCAPSAKGIDLSLPEKDDPTSSRRVSAEGEAEQRSTRASGRGDRRSAELKGSLVSPEWNLAHGIPVTEEQLALERRRDAAIGAFESAFHDIRWPWGTSKVWRKMLDFVVKEYQEDPQIFREYVEWMEGAGRFTAVKAHQIRSRPQQFIDTGWPMFMASRRHEEPERAPVETDLMRRIRERKEANERAMEK